MSQAALKRERQIVRHPRGADFDMIAVVSEAGQPNAMSQRDRRQFRGMFVEDRLDKHLRAPVRQFGRAPIAGQLLDHPPRVARRGQFDARQFIFCIAGEIGHVGRVVRRHAERANLVGEAKPAVVLHGAGLRRVGLRVGRCAELLVDEDRGHAAPPEFIRQHETARTPARDQDRRVKRANRVQLLSPQAKGAQKLPNASRIDKSLPAYALALAPRTLSGRSPFGPDEPNGNRFDSNVLPKIRKQAKLDP